MADSEDKSHGQEEEAVKTQERCEDEEGDCEVTHDYAQAHQALPAPPQMGNRGPYSGTPKTEQDIQRHLEGSRKSSSCTYTYGSGTSQRSFHFHLFRSPLAVIKQLLFLESIQHAAIQCIHIIVPQ